MSLIKSGPLPRYYQLKELIREKIRTGEWNPGDLIPSERELGEQYGISRMTTRQSLNELVNEGYLYREQGKGTFVAHPKIIQQLTSLTSFTEDIQRRKQRPGAKMLEASMQPADETAVDRLRVRPGQPVLRLRRLRLADSEPLAVENSLINFIGCEQLLEEDLERDSLYQLLEAKFGFPLMEAEQELESGLAGEEAPILGAEPGSAVLLTRRTTYTHRNQPIEYAVSVYRGDKYKFYAKLMRQQVFP